MEIVVNPRKVWLTLFLLAIIAIAWVVYQETRTTTADPAPTAGLTVEFVDASTQWDWQPGACAERLPAFVQDADQLTVTLVDDGAEIAFVAAFPTAAASDPALAAATCERHARHITCQVGPRQGVGNNLAVAVGAIVAAALQEEARPKTQEAWNARPAWVWDNFQPVISKEDARWSSCFVLSSAK